MNEEVRFTEVSLDKMDDAELEAICDRVLASEDGATAMRSLMRSAMASALRSAIKPVPPGDD